MNLYVRPFVCTNEQTPISFHLQASCAPLSALAPPRLTPTRRGISGVVAPPPLLPLPPEYEMKMTRGEGPTDGRTDTHALIDSLFRCVRISIRVLVRRSVGPSVRRLVRRCSLRALDLWRLALFFKRLSRNNAGVDDFLIKASFYTYKFIISCLPM